MRNNHQKKGEEMTTIAETALYNHACREGRAWLDTQPDLETAWDNCDNPEWMLWCLNHVGCQNDKELRLFACWCVRNMPLHDGRTVWDLLTDERSRHAVEVAERFANGDATDDDLASARVAAMVAAWDAGTDARVAAYAASVDAGWAAYAALKEASAAMEASANQLRTMVPNPFTGNEMKE